MARKILFPIVADRDSSWGIAFLERLRQQEPIAVDLLSVQQPFTVHVRMFFRGEEMQAFHREDAERELAPVRRALDEARIPYRTHMVVGYGAEAIASFAQEHRSSQIVLGPAAGLGFTNMILGSLTRQVRALMESAGAPCEVL